MACTRPQCYLVPFGGGRPKPFMADYAIGDLYPLGRIVYLPCGGCISCRRERRQELTLLQCCEASLYDNNWFLTLTYDDKKCLEISNELPCSLVKSHIQNFLESMRKALKYQEVQFRYYGCGEYGELYNRPHYHLSIFGLSPENLGLETDYQGFISRRNALSNFGVTQVYKHAELDSNGNPYWYSPLVGSRWQFGHHKLYRANRETFQYVAGYVTKKLTGKLARERLVKENKIPEFSFQSRPSIGFPWFQKYMSSIIGHQLIGEVLELAGTKWKCPRIFDKWLERTSDGPEILERIKLIRSESIEPIPDRDKLRKKDAYEIYRDNQFSILNKTQMKGIKQDEN